MDKRITAFIRRHHVLTLATSGGEGIWCSNIFYAYDPGRNRFVFTSDDHTRHVRQAAEEGRVAASVVLESRVVGRLQGLQITGRLRRAEDDEERARKIYLKRFPYAALAELHLWILDPEHFKFTDNTLGFGKKLYWNAEDGER